VGEQFFSDLVKRVGILLLFARCIYRVSSYGFTNSLKQAGEDLAVRGTNVKRIQTQLKK
jgi:hypothetical protein